MLSEIRTKVGHPVVFEATRSVQLPGGQGTSSGGKAEFVPPLARLAVAVGVSEGFIKIHEEPSRSPSDGPNMVRLDEMEGLSTRLKVLDGIENLDTAGQMTD